MLVFKSRDPGLCCAVLLAINNFNIRAGCLIILLVFEPWLAHNVMILRAIIHTGEQRQLFTNYVYEHRFAQSSSIPASSDNKPFNQGLNLSSALNIIANLSKY
jgi:hypothetical protein